MEFERNDPPREFQVGAGPKITIRDCGRVRLAANEQVTFVTETDAEYDVARKDWGYYATPSTNGRLATFGLRTALVTNPAGKLYVMLVESGKELAFTDYLKEDQQQLLMWVDDDQSVQQLQAFAQQRRESHVDKV